MNRLYAEVLRMRANIDMKCSTAAALEIRGGPGSVDSLAHAKRPKLVMSGTVVLLCCVIQELRKLRLIVIRGDWPAGNSHRPF